MRKLPVRSQRCGKGDTQIAHSFSSCSQLCSIPHERRQKSTSPGRTATCRTDRRSTCCQRSRHKSSVSLPASAKAYSHGACGTLQISKAWTRTSSEATSEVAQWIFARFYFGRPGGNMRHRQRKFTSALHPLRREAVSTECVAIMPLNSLFPGSHWAAQIHTTKFATIQAVRSNIANGPRIPPAVLFARLTDLRVLEAQPVSYIRPVELSLTAFLTPVANPHARTAPERARQTSTFAPRSTPSPVSC